ncbi:TM2 domain-containing protein [Nocardioides sambongensis]|uniref:TM2 domain-containing protein n=1 Tax=Nocardioides sambongensis TaxID=2589074 RepID=UPI00112CE454|nr:TM2 domain-containing protein [Nocardioides sambongensis]
MTQQPPWGEPGEDRHYEPYEPYDPTARGPHVPPPVGYPVPGWQYGLDPATGLPLSDKSKVAAGLLQMLLPLIGIAGVGRLYAGHVGIGLVQLLGVLVGYLLICVVIGILVVPAMLLWSFVDGIVILASSHPRDGSGRVMR